MVMTALRRENASAIFGAISADTRRRLGKFTAEETNEVWPISDHRDIPPCIAWDGGLNGSKKLAATLRAQGFDVRQTKHAVAAWAPVGWTQYIDPEGNVRFLDEFTVLRMVWTNLNDGLPEIKLYTRLEIGYNQLNRHYYLYDRQEGKVLKWCDTPMEMEHFVSQNYPDYDNPSAYRGELPSPKSKPWWKIWN